MKRSRHMRGGGPFGDEFDSSPGENGDDFRSPDGGRVFTGDDDRIHYIDSMGRNSTVPNRSDREAYAAYEDRKRQIIERNQSERNLAADKSRGLIPGTTSGLQKFTDGLVKVADYAIPLASYAGMSPAMMEAYKAFAPPGSKFYTDKSLSDKFGDFATGVGRSKASAAASGAVKRAVGMGKRSKYVRLSGTGEVEFVRKPSSHKMFHAK